MINAINPSYSNSYNRNYKPTLPKVQPQMSFKAHPDFIELSKAYDVTASSYFRRGPFYGSPSDRFQDIVNVFKRIFTPNFSEPKKMLIVGIGDSQETFSHLATIKNVRQDRPLSGLVDLHIIDLQSKPAPEKIRECSFFEYTYKPDFAPDSFILDKNNTSYHFYRCYRVLDEILDFVQNAYANTKNSKWETRLQEALPEYKPETFDIISINNTLSYIRDDATRHQAVQDTLKALKMNGIYITDPWADTRLKCAGVAESFEKLYDGIYRKISDKINPLNDIK